jgi:hypothetical protein
MRSITLILSLTLLLFFQRVNSASLLSNFDSLVDGDYGGAPDAANPFSTGTSPLIIGSISVNWELPGASPSINAVAIYEDDAGFPGDVQVGTMFTNPNPTTAGKMRYIGNAQLNANTNYWVVIDINDGSEPAFTFTNVVTSDISTGGADIPAGSAFGDDSTGDWFDDPASLIIELDDLIFASGFD